MGFWYSQKPWIGPERCDLELIRPDINLRKPSDPVPLGARCFICSPSLHIQQGPREKGFFPPLFLLTGTQSCTVLGKLLGFLASSWLPCGPSPCLLHGLSSLSVSVSSCSCHYLCTEHSTTVSCWYKSLLTAYKGTRRLWPCKHFCVSHKTSRAPCVW